MIMDFEDLIGKTITDAKQLHLKDYDDEGYLLLTFSDNSKCLIESYYVKCTGNSEDEYPTGINIISEQNIDFTKFEK